MGTTEVESFVAVANMFLGHTDSPILVSKYLKDLTDSEIFLILVSGYLEWEVCQHPSLEATTCLEFRWNIF